MKLSIAEGRDIFASSFQKEAAKKKYEDYNVFRILSLIGKEEDRYPYEYEKKDKKKLSVCICMFFYFGMRFASKCLYVCWYDICKKAKNF